MYDALTIAKWFVAFAEANEADCSNLKLQKLLYFAQGHYLAASGEMSRRPLDQRLRGLLHSSVT